MFQLPYRHKNKEKLKSLQKSKAGVSLFSGFLIFNKFQFRLIPKKIPIFIGTSKL